MAGPPRWSLLSRRSAGWRVAHLRGEGEYRLKVAKEDFSSNFESALNPILFLVTKEASITPLSLVILDLLEAKL